MSKGSRQRPVKDPTKFEDNWDKIFAKKKQTKSDWNPAQSVDQYNEQTEKRNDT